MIGGSRWSREEPSLETNPLNDQASVTSTSVEETQANEHQAQAARQQVVANRQQDADPQRQRAARHCQRLCLSQALFVPLVLDAEAFASSYLAE